MDALNLVESVGAGWLVAEWIIRISSLFFVPRNRKPSSGTAWLLLIFFFPFLGLFLYLVLGSPKLPKVRREAQKNLDQIIQKNVQKTVKNAKRAALLRATIPEKYTPLAKLSESLSHLPIFGGNKIDLLPEYTDIITKIAEDIDSAKHFVYLEYFIIILDDTTIPIFDAIARATARGVTVRVMYDSLSTKHLKKKWYGPTLRRLAADGAIIRAILPLRIPGRGYVRPDLRNHRKICVIDGEIAFTGSLNLIGRNYHRKDNIYYDELVVRSQGPVALQFSVVFISDWYSETGEMLETKTLRRVRSKLQSFGNTPAQVLPSGPGYDDENNLKLFTALIHSAREKLVITNPYFVPDDALTTAITSASRRGVEVIMINSEAMDQWLVGHAQRSYYQILLEAGVKIYLYKAPVLLHSKFMTVDGEIAIVGSSNLDIRSFSLNLEVTLVLYDKSLALELGKVQKQYLATSRLLELDKWRERSRTQQLFDNIARLTAALQ